ncbi:MAG: tetratricopeptide repeat protein [Rhodothermales bacterium]
MRRSLDAVLSGSRFLMVFALLLLCGRSSDGQSRTFSAQADFSEAFRLYSDGLYRQSARAFEAFRLDWPNDLSVPEATYYEAESRLASGDTDQAVRLLTGFQSRYPNHPLSYKANLAIGQYFFERGEHEKAIETFNTVLASSPPDDLAARALYWMGESAVKLERPDEAIRYFSRAANEYPGTAVAPNALYAIAFAELKRNRYDEAARALELLAARHPNSEHARNVGLALAEVYYELGDYRRAIEEAERRLPNASGEERVRALFLLAESNNQLRNSEDAIVLYRQITEGYPESAFYRRAQYGLGWNYYYQGAWEWAGNEFEKVAAGRDDDLAARATYYEGVSRKLNARPQEAISLFQEVVTRWPNGPTTEYALFELGMALYEARDWEAAGAAFASLVDRYPSSEHVGEALTYRANCFIAIGDLDNAFVTFDRAISQSASDPAVHSEIVFQKAWLQYRNASYDAAAKAFLKLYEDDESAVWQAQSLFWAAESYYQLRNYDRARTLFLRYLGDFPGGDQADAAHYALGWTYFKQSDYGPAVREFTSFLNSYKETNEFVPYRDDARLRLADSYFAMKQYSDAIRNYRAAADNGDDYALYQIGQAYKNANEYSSSLAAFRNLLSEFRDSPFREEAQYSIGEIHFQNQDFDAAVNAYRELIKTAPRDPLAAKAQYGIGDALFNAGRLDEAIHAYEAVLRDYPRSVFAGDAASSLQFAFAALDDDAKAEAFVDSFAVANPDSPLVDELRFKQAEVKFQSGRTDAALADFQRFVRTARNEQLLPEAYYYLGTIYYDRDQLAEAQSYLRQIVMGNAAHPRKAAATQTLGEIYLKENRPAEALALFQDLEEQTSDPLEVAAARYGQSVALSQLGRTSEARTLLQRTIEASPNDPRTVPAELGLARLNETSGNIPDALAGYRSIVRRSQDERGAEALARLGALLLRQGNAAEAAEEMARMPILFGGYPEWLAEGYLTQARAFVKLGQTGDAVRTYDLLIRQYSGTPQAETARQEREQL